MMTSKIFAITFVLLFTPVIYSEDSATSHLHTVEQYFAAFNAHDSAAMAKYVTDDVVWFSISDDKLAIETKGKSALITSMDAYFASCPTCQSSLSETTSTSSRISAIETTSWQGKSGSKSQRSISVYEFSDGLIQRVYYFPAER